MMRRLARSSGADSERREVRRASAGVDCQARAAGRAHQGQLEQRGESEDKAEEIAARTVNKERA